MTLRRWKGGEPPASFLPTLGSCATTRKSVTACWICSTAKFAGPRCSGGSRFVLPDNQGWELLITDADIEGLPDRQPARFVDRRTYSEYAVFWPSGDAALNPEAQRQWQQPLSNGGTTPAGWMQANLDPATGQVKLGVIGLVPGYAFVIPDPPETGIGALPARCPLCAVNYRYRLYRKSPIRGFRTGFGRVTQILSKEMFYFLPESSRKLVAFSDSRQDAAELANGIERSHYTDLVREAMCEELWKAAMTPRAARTGIKSQHGHRRDGESAGGMPVRYCNNPK